MNKEISSKIRVRYVTWSDVQRILANLAKTVSSVYRPEVIVAIAKGGLIPARVISDILGVEETGYIEVKFYKGVGIRGEKPFVKSIAVPLIKDKNVLIVDDVVDSGRTVQLVIDTLSVYAPRVLKSLVLYVKPWSTYNPDFYYEVTNDWIVFPWEVCETLKEGIFIDVDEFKKASNYCLSFKSD